MRRWHFLLFLFRANCSSSSSNYRGLGMCVAAAERTCFLASTTREKLMKVTARKMCNRPAFHGVYTRTKSRVYIYVDVIKWCMIGHTLVWKISSPARGTWKLFSDSESDFIIISIGATIIHTLGLMLNNGSFATSYIAAFNWKSFEHIAAFAA